MASIESFSEADFQTLLDEASRLGKQAGEDAAFAFVFDDPSEVEQCVALDACDDPSWDELYRCTDPLSGEFAGDWTPSELLDALSVVVSPEEEGEICSSFEESFCKSYRTSLLRAAKMFFSEG